MAFRGRGRAAYQSDNHAATSGQPPPEHNITRHPQCNVAEIPDDWLQSLKHSWNVFKGGEHVKRMLYNYLGFCQNPYASMLQIMSECNDFYHSKAKSMASFVAETFANWIAPQEGAYRHCLTKELKNEAFTLVTQQKNIALTRLVFNTFHLNDNATDYLAQIRFMADCKMYKEACQCASLLNLLKYFTLEELVLPLVLQDKHAVAEEALVQVPEMQKELVAFLDNLLGRRNLTAEIDNLLTKLDVPDVKFEVVYYPKPLGKLIARLIKKFELPQDLAPNLNKKRTGGALQFLIRKRYKDNLNSESWNEMVKEAVGDDPQLQMELVCTVNNYGDNHEALYWAHYFKIPKEKWPYNVRLLDRDDPEAKYCQPKAACEEDDGSEENWGNEYVAFLQLSLPDSALVMIDTEVALQRLIHVFTHTGVTVAGMDSEWKPAFAGRQSELALVQVATRERVFIIDVVNLAGRAPDVWNQLGNCLFRNKDILKLGFDIVNDLQMIKNALPEMGQIKQNGHGYLDLSLLWKRLTNSHKLVLPYRDASKNSTSESLSQLVFLTMGRGLNKANQFSNWEQRPLRIGQLRYAALDAFCLLDVYEILRQCSDEQNIPFYEICDEIMLNYKGPRRSYGNSSAPKKKTPMILGAVSNVILPSVFVSENGSGPLVGDAKTSEQQSLKKNDRKEQTEIGSRVYENEDKKVAYNDVKSAMTALDRMVEDLDDNARAVWKAEVEGRVEDLKELVNYGKKKFAVLQNNTPSRNDSSSNHSPRRRGRSTSVSSTGVRFCWYHTRFGARAGNCQQPCDFNKEHNGHRSVSGWYQQQSQVLERLSDDLKKMSLNLSRCRTRSHSRGESRNRSPNRSYSRSRNRSPNRSYSRFRNRSPNRSYSRSGYRSRTPSRDCYINNVRSPPSICSSEGTCWYHLQFGESAKRCQSPCDFYNDYSVEYNDNSVEYDGNW